MLVAFLGGRGDPAGKNFARFVVARFAREKLAVHQVSWNVVRVPFEQRAKMRVGGGRIAAIHALHREAIAGESVIGFFRDELFEHLAAGFLLVSHGWLAYYTGSAAEKEFYTEGAENTEYAEKKSTRIGERMKSTRLVKSEMSGELAPKGKPVSASRSEMTEIVLPAQTNPLGKLLGGQVMHLVDMVAAMAAHRHSNSYVVTASVDSIDFRNPINLGEIVNLKSQVNRVFRTSMEVGVEVYSENAMTGERKHTTSAYVTFVAIDENTNLPKRVAPLIVKTAEERRRFREAAKRREVRLALRYGKKHGVK